MTPIPMRDRLQFIATLLLVLLITALSYTALHEGGHALAGLSFGGRITDFNVNFFNLGAHVGIDGKFSQSQLAVINVSGVILPFLAWALMMLALPKKDIANLQWIKIISAMGFINSLLAWVILPFLYLAGKAPPSDDVTKFIHNSGLPALAVGLSAPWFVYLYLRSGHFISTSAIVGFGGAAGMFGMSLLWLTFCNVFVGIFIAFMLLGSRTRRIGRVLDALEAQANECALVEDTVRNLEPAHKLGIKTILVDADGEADACIETIYGVADAVEQLDRE